MKKEPIVPGGITTKTISFVDGNGKTFFADIDFTSTSGKFLQVLKVYDSTIPFFRKEYKTDKELEPFLSEPDFEKKYESALRLLKQKTDAQKVTREAAITAATESGMIDTWNGVTPYQFGQPVVGTVSPTTQPVGAGVTININYAPVGISTAGDAEAFVTSI